MKSWDLWRNRKTGYQAGWIIKLAPMVREMEKCMGKNEIVGYEPLVREYIKILCRWTLTVFYAYQDHIWWGSQNYPKE